MITDLSLAFRYIALAQAVFVVTYLLFFKKKEKNSLIIFTLFFVSFSTPAIEYILSGLGIYDNYRKLSFLPIGFYYFSMPLYYLYIKSLIENVEPKKMLWLLIPGIVEFLFLLVLFCIPTKYALNFSAQYNWIFTWFYGILLNIFSLYCIYLAFRAVNAYQVKYLNYFSNTQKVNLEWIRNTLMILVVIYVFQLLNVYFLFDQEQRQVVHLIDSILTNLFIYWTSIYAIRQSHISSDFQIFSGNKSSSVADISDYQKIGSVLLSSKIYKNPNLTVLELSDMVALHPKKVSQAINHFSDKNFNHFINSLRIDEAKSLLTDPKHNNLTIEALAQEAGFNSKSVFNTLFKAETGQTPKAYKTHAEA